MVPAKYFLLSKYFPPSALQLLRSHFLKDSKLFLKKLGVNFANNGLNTFWITLEKLQRFTQTVPTSLGEMKISVLCFFACLFKASNQKSGSRLGPFSLLIFFTLPFCF